MVWDQLREIIFDDTTITGLRNGFLGNLMTETVGVLAGAGIGAAIANWLDGRREAKRMTDHRVRASTRWVSNHNNMLVRIRRYVGQGERESRLEARGDAIASAIEYANGVYNDYADALGRAKIVSAFPVYIDALEKLGTLVTSPTFEIVNVRDASLAAFDQLEHIVMKAIPQTEVAEFQLRLKDVHARAALA